MERLHSPLRFRHRTLKMTAASLPTPEHDVSQELNYFVKGEKERERERGREGEGWADEVRDRWRHVVTHSG